MLISDRDGIINIDDFEKVYRCESFSVYLNGLIFCRGFKEGRESIQKICHEIERTNAIPFASLFGSFAMVIDYNGKQQVAFTDNSCMHGFFVSNHSVSSSFREIIQYEEIKEFDDIGICEYMELIRGGFSHRTYVKDVTFSSNLEYYVICDGRINREEKAIGSIDMKSGIDNPMDFFADISYAFSDKKSICALTGGFDSRAVASVLNKFRKYDCFISGDNDKSSEIIQAKKTAKAGGYVMKHIRPEYPVISDDIICEKFLSGGSYHVSFATGEFRIAYFMNQLRNEDYDVLMDGNAGDMHKELWFTQEFPFYRRKKSRPKFFYKSRMEQYSPILGTAVSDYINEMEKLELNELKNLTKETNAKSCLFYGWYHDWFSMAARNTVSTSPALYSPLQEIELVRFSYNMMPKGKFMNYFLRDLISKANINVARVKTIYGTTASTEVLYLVKDFFAQMVRYCQQGIRFFVRKVFHKSIFISQVNLKSVDDDVMQTRIVEEAFKWAQEMKLIIRDVELSEIPFSLMEKLLNLYLTEQYCFQNKTRV